MVTRKWRASIPGSVLILLASKAQAQPSYQIAPLGFTGSGYSYVSGGGNFQSSYAVQLNIVGDVIGYSSRYDSSGNYLGQDAWLYNGSTTQLLTLNGSNYSYTPGTGGTYQYSTPIGVNAAGQVIGATSRYDASGNYIGQDAWAFNGSTLQQIGLTGSNYGYVSGGETIQFTTALAPNSSGQTVGTTLQASGGADAWFFNGTSTQQIGLTGALYAYTNGSSIFAQSQVVGLNDAGQATGSTGRLDPTGNSLGADAWIFSGGTSQQIGLNGGVYSYTNTGGTFQYSAPVQINTAGQVIGASNRYDGSGNALGQDAWVYNGASSQQIGLTGGNYSYTPGTGGTYQYSAPIQINTAGQVIGTSNRYDGSGNSLGQDSWLASGSNTQQIGMTGGVYSYAASGGTYQSSSPLQMNNAGHVIGISNRYDSSGDSLGQDSWVYEGGTNSRQIGLTGGVYSYTPNTGGIYQSSTPVQINAPGQVIGTAARYDSSGDDLGQAGWFYDPTTKATTALEFSYESGNNYSYTNPVVLTDTGVVLGNFELFDGSTDEGSYAFYWSESHGFYDLGSLVNGGLNAQGWQYLADVYDSTTPGAIGSAPDGSPLDILGDGQMNDEAGVTGGNSVFLMTQSVPEPTALVPLAMGLLLLKRRPRRRGVG